MGYRDIIVPMDEAASAATRVAFAADVAARFGARLIGAFAKTQVSPPFMPPDAMALLTTEEVDRINADHDKRVDAAAEKARGLFESAAAAAGVQSDWYVLENSGELVACGRRADLMVLTAEPGRAEVFNPASLVMEVGLPALLVPPALRYSTFKRILVAWNGSREAARALNAAWPLIFLADDVDVLLVAGRGSGGPEGILQRRFEHRGIKANVILDDSDDTAAGKVLRRQITSLAPDLVIMGLYGHTRIRELILGGASRELLADSKVPLFVCH